MSNKYMNDERTQELINNIKDRFSAVNTALDNKLDKSYAPYKAGGSYTFENIPAASAASVGLVYNITNSFETTADFIEGAGISCAAGTDVAVVVASTDPVTYKYNIFGGSGSATIENITSEELAEMWKDAGSVVLSSNSVSIVENGTDTITVTSATGTVSVESGDENVATVEIEGDTITITAIAEGETTVIATSASTLDYKAASASITVTVTAAE